MSDFNELFDISKKVNELHTFKENSWDKVAQSFNITSSDLDTLSVHLGYPSFEGMSGLDISIGPGSLYKRNPQKFITALQRTSLKAEEMSPEEIKQILYKICPDLS